MHILLALAFCLSGEDEPSRLEIPEVDRPVLVTGIPFQLTVRTNEEFSGLVEVEGIRGENKVWVAKGRGVLRNVIADKDTIRVRRGGHVRQLRPRFLSPWLCLVPPILAILLAFVTRQVIPSILGGLFTGAGILWATDFTGLAMSVPRALDVISSEVAEPHHARILLMLLAMGGLIGILVYSGAMRGLADRLSELLRTRRSAMLGTWGLCLVLFFDDYANSLIAGNTMRPIADRLRISREKLSYLVDSTVGPMTALGLVSTWMLFEEKTLLATGAVTHADFAGIVLHLAPYSFYTLLALVLVFLVAFSQRDFGPMYRAEVRAITTGQVLRIQARPMVDREISDVPHIEILRERWTGAAIPIFSLIVFTVASLAVSGLRNPARPHGKSTFLDLLEYGRPYLSFLVGTVAATVVAVVFAWLRKHLDALQSIEAWLRGMKAILIAAVILVLAWSMAQICQNLSVGRILVFQMGGLAVSPWLPAITFLLCALVCLSTGSAWGTLALMLPVVSPVAMGADVSEGIRYGTLAAVMSGSLFGDHISPISDTTVISSLGASADHIDHVRTQAPYALLAGGAAVLLGFIPAGFGWSPWLCLALGAAALAAVVFTVAKKLPPIASEEE